MPHPDPASVLYDLRTQCDMLRRTVRERDVSVVQLRQQNDQLLAENVQLRQQVDRLLVVSTRLTDMYEGVVETLDDLREKMNALRAG